MAPSEIGASFAKSNCVTGRVERERDWRPDGLVLVLVLVRLDMLFVGFRFERVGLGTFLLPWRFGLGRWTAMFLSNILKW